MKCKEIFFSHLTKGLRAVQCWTYSWSAYKYLGRANILWPWRFQIENIQHRTETTFHLFDVAKESTGSSPLNDSPEIVFTSDQKNWRVRTELLYLLVPESSDKMLIWFMAKGTRIILTDSFEASRFLKYRNTLGWHQICNRYSFIYSLVVL